MSKKIKIGIIGVGSISSVHINAYLKNENVELYAFCDINQEQLEKRAKEYGITRTFATKEEMLALPEIDAVSVCVWNSAHAECTIAALNAGKHVICEKPMAISSEDAKKMEDAAKANNKLLMIGFVRRFGRDCSILKDFIDNGDLGNIYYAKAKYLRRHGNPGGWFGNKAFSGGGPLIDLGVHVVDLMWYLMGKPKAVSVYGATFSELGKREDIKDKVNYSSVGRSKEDIYDVEDLAVAMIRFENGSVINFEASFSLNIKDGENSIELMGTKGGASISPELQIFTNKNGHMINQSFHSSTAIDFDNIFVNEINHFVSCVVDGTKCISPAVDGVEIIKILEAIYKSAELKKEIVL